MKVAVEGCCHGELDAIYDHVESLERRHNYKVDLLLICGDFEAIRNNRDLQCMAVPDKYKQLGDFHKYYTGEKKAPILTIVIGGNHEASNYFWELYHGGWIAPNIYFLGHAGCIRVDGIRIAGASGIFKGHDFRKGHYERLPYSQGSMRSIYHIREFNIRRLSLLSSPDIFLSHDWPQSIEQHGDVQGLLRRKKFLTADVRSGRLGSGPLMGLLQTLKPSWWFAAHLHTRFEALVSHGPPQPVASVEGTNPDEINISDDDDIPRNPDEITLSDEETEVAPPPVPLPPPKETRFLALDKCLPNRQFLEVVDISTPSDPLAGEGRRMPTLTFDPEWLAIVRAFDTHFSLTSMQPAFPDETEARAAVARELEWIEQHVQADKPVDECQQFACTAPGPGSEGTDARLQPPAYRNPQTEAFCSMLGLQSKINVD